MKKIYFTIIALLSVIFILAYLYFSKLNADSNNNDNSLYAATANSGLIFCIQNNKSIIDILKSQDLLKKMIGEDKYKQFESLKDQLLSDPDLNQLIHDQNLYISFLGGKGKNIDFLMSIQMVTDEDETTLLNTLKSKHIQTENIQKIKRLTLSDSSIFYMGIHNKLILLSNAPEPVLNTIDLSKDKRKDNFVEYIKSHTGSTKNSLASVYINFNQLPKLISSILPGKLRGKLSLFDHQNSYACFSYNFSKERLLFNGNTNVLDNTSYFNLFSKLKPQKIVIDNILPENTANYTVYVMGMYRAWQKTLNNWFLLKKEKQKIQEIIQNVGSKYHLDLEDTFPKYTKNQIITFQLNTGEKLGAINLTNGDKLSQLLIDLSQDYNSDIKIFKEENLLYCYFGEPFKKFKRPYYTIINNYMIFSNNASTVQVFLNAYRKNNQLINSPAYSEACNQLVATSNIFFYVNKEKSDNIVRKNIYLPYYKYYKSEKGLKNFDSFIYQISADNDRFQTNLLISLKPGALKADTLLNK